MIKLEKWFPDGMKKEYLAKILKKVEEKNIGSSDHDSERKEEA